MEQPEILYRKTPSLAIISMNKPEIKNAFTAGMMDSLCLALTDAKDDPDVKVIIITGEGGSFSAGANVNDMAKGQLSSWNMKNYLWDHVQRVPILLEDVDKPVIGAIDGTAYGGGFDLCLTCDLRIASERAVFCSNFARIGLLPGDGGTYNLPRLVGVSKALEIMLTSRVIRSEEALQIGLVDRVVPSEAFSKDVEKYAMEIARWPLSSLRAIKRAVYNGLTSDLRGHLDYVSSQLSLLTETAEHQAAMEELVKKMKR